MLRRTILAEALLGMFEMAPMAICISTADPGESICVMANPAYLELVGRSLDDVVGRPLTASAAIDGPQRDRRLALLEGEGRYRNEDAAIRHASGRTIPVLITALRSRLGGLAVDIEAIVDNSEQVRHRERLAEAARTDALTGLRNRAGFEHDLASRVAVDAQEGDGPCLAFIDLNGFKSINDLHGHDVGDEFLRMVARRLKNRARGADCVARLGGDEFAIVFARATDGERTMAKRMRAIVDAAFRPVDVRGRILVGGAAVGLAFSRQGDGPRSLLVRADAAMYRAKSTGRRISVRTDGRDTKGARGGEA